MMSEAIDSRILSKLVNVYKKARYASNTWNEFGSSESHDESMSWLDKAITELENETDFLKHDISKL